MLTTTAMAGTVAGVAAARLWTTPGTHRVAPLSVHSRVPVPSPLAGSVPFGRFRERPVTCGFAAPGVLTPVELRCCNYYLILGLPRGGYTTSCGCAPLGGRRDIRRHEALGGPGQGRIEPHGDGTGAARHRHPTALHQPCRAPVRRDRVGAARRPDHQLPGRHGRLRAAR